MGPLRICPSCGAQQAVAAGEAVWPTNWICGTCCHAAEQLDGILAFAPDLADTPTGFDPKSFSALNKSEDGHYWFEPRNRLITALIHRYFPTTSRYLEIGCGTGFVLRGVREALPDAELVGSEIHPAGLTHARRRLADTASVQFVQMDARRIPAREAFDLVGAYDVIEHIDEDERVLAELHATLVPGGGAVIAVPQHPLLWSQADELGHHVRRYRRGELEAKMRAAGFEVLFSSSYTAVLLPLMAASRMRRSRPEQLEAMLKREFDMAAPVNAVLRAVLHTEVTVTLAGLRWPAGGSRIVVGRKPKPKLAA
ncbi:MAG: class I SAM-dependent methyltransferase [Alphaproteobacteria bacterium]|uniref:Putative methyltransferase n=1 Tax=viral metagenome TaxID=1070528 RepID=A0A6M3XCP8_9ZZZZ|nr:class I SAM-dependent methyltransferase [Alphaproteobacteria bacterium]MBU1549457.1 class I SAM-dependent methyltransferase [Alphaproteobacteria bacterium]MBU2337006.1 class I SAM-dependent methyltransferase [Alphaproteobacteria bacterium]MBU2391445.1 class I SAM-dependent methyltransferase [Alphaproteobacteria bacterium]